MSEPLTCYLAGPYRAPHAYQREVNISSAWLWAVEVAKLGIFPLCPHTLTAHMDGVQPDEFWLQGRMRLLRSADVVLLLPGWQASTGARAELADALARNIPVCNDLKQLAQWRTLHDVEPASAPADRPETDQPAA